MYAKQIEMWRKRLGMTQGQAATALLTSPHTYVQWERGRRAPPTCLPLACELVELRAAEGYSAPPADWPARLRALLDRGAGAWPEVWGPLPFLEGSPCPAEVLAEFRRSDPRLRALIAEFERQAS